MKGRPVSEFKAAHDPHTIIARLESEIRRLSQESADAAAIKAIVGTASDSLEKYTPPPWTVAKPTRDTSPGVPTRTASPSKSLHSKVGDFWSSKRPLNSLMWPWRSRCRAWPAWR